MAASEKSVDNAATLLLGNDNSSKDAIANGEQESLKANPQDAEAWVYRNFGRRFRTSGFINRNRFLGT